MKTKNNLKVKVKLKWKVHTRGGRAIGYYGDYLASADDPVLEVVTEGGAKKEITYNVIRISEDRGYTMRFVQYERDKMSIEDTDFASIGEAKEYAQKHLDARVKEVVGKLIGGN